MRPEYYKLQGEEVVACSMEEWSEMLKKPDRILGKAQSKKKGITVSTVFLGLDYNFSKHGPPLLFESMVFGIEDEICIRYSTYKKAMLGHAQLASKFGLVEPSVLNPGPPPEERVLRPFKKLNLRR